MIIANHSLVMADADLGGGVILPAPEETIYVFDEAHHLPTVAREHASAAATLKGAASWLEKLNQSLSKFTALGDEKRAERFAEEARTAIQYLIPTLNQLPKQFMAEQLLREFTVLSTASYHNGWLMSHKHLVSHHKSDAICE